MDWKLGGIVVLLAGCASTGVIQTNPGVYTISKRAAQAGFGPPVAAKADVYKEANAYCAARGQQVETVNTAETPSGFGRPSAFTLEFRCK